MEVARLGPWLRALVLPGAAAALAAPALEDAAARLRFLEEVGLGYLAPARAADTLSGGELRRARLAAACAARMSGLLFLLDEPTAGLHPADRPRLRQRLRSLVEEGNTLVCVEHDPEMLLHADHVVELGPGAGVRGGRVLASASATKVLKAASTPTAAALARAPTPPRAEPRHGAPDVHARGVTFRNLRDVAFSFPSRGLTCVTGVSGAGKSTLLLDVLAPAASAAVGRRPLPAGRLRALEGAGAFDHVSEARGSPARHPRATPGGVLGVLAPLRRLYASTLEARARGWAPARFSTHVKGGRCEACRGTGERTVALRDMPEVRVACDACGGRKFTRETNQVRVKGLSIADALDLPIEGAAVIFRDLPRVGSALRAASDVGLGYVPLGEPTSRLSGGEALRLRLAAALGRGATSRTLYLLDEPCAGLHPDDVAHLLRVLLELAAAGNAVVAVEHHPQMIREADHVIELGPGPGEAGGRVLHQGPPAGLLAVPGSPTAAYLG
jgi:excinuclease ABC subunit A